MFEPEFCEELIATYERHGGQPSGFMCDVNGKTVVVVDAKFKQRRDLEIDEAPLRGQIVERIKRRVTPALRQAFQFEATRIERYIVSCYEAGAGHFRAHRDNTSKGTAHRKFAVSINLNAGDYDGGDLRFPEFGSRTYCPPRGGAVVFSCSLLHEATLVTAGKRYAFLPFLYDDAGAQLRIENNRFLDKNVPKYEP